MVDPRANAMPPEVDTEMARAAELGRLILRAGEQHLRQAADLLDLGLPTAACRSASRDGRHALWLGPDEWLVVADDPSAIGTLSRRLSDLPCSVVDVGHRQVGIRLYGPACETVLSSGCPLDLALTSFPVGACTRTIFNKAEVILWRTADRQFHVEVWRSFAPYVEALLGIAIREQRERASP